MRDSAAALGEVYLSARPGDTVALDVVRDGGPPSRYSATFRERRGATSLPALVRLLVGSTVLFPFVLLGVALPVLFYRLDDRNAWLLAILFLCLTAAPGFPNGFAGLDGPWRAFAMAWRSLLGGLLGAAFYWLFALFPVRSPVDRRAPWLKWALLAFGVARGLGGLGSGEPAFPAALAGSIGPEAVGGVGLVLGYAALALGFAALLGNAWRPTTPDARRKIHVVAWGAAVGILPAVALAVVQDLGWRMPEWVSGVALLLLFAFPLSFAYAVVRHRVLELPVLLKRSARYVLVRRGFGVLLVVLALAANALFALSFTRLFRVDATFATSAGVGFGLALASVAAPGVRRATRRIDRAFFREAYDARVVLEELAGRIRAVESREEVGRLLEEQVARALRPSSVRAWIAGPDGSLRAGGDTLPVAAEALAVLARDSPPARGPLGTTARPRSRRSHPATSSRSRRAASCSGSSLSASGCRRSPTRARTRGCSRRWPGRRPLPSRTCASPRASPSASRRSGAPRTRWTSRAGCRPSCCRAQGRRLASLECDGRCVQARAVGGDFLDFVDGGPGGERLSLVLADVSGKGLAAALLMASLQASLRTLSPRGEGLRERLAAANRLLVETTEPSRYATLFVGDHEPGRLRYVNCGHNPPMLLRASGGVERLMPTAMVVGLVDDWTCEVVDTARRAGRPARRLQRRHQRGGRRRRRGVRRAPAARGR